MPGRELDPRELPRQRAPRDRVSRAPRCARDHAVEGATYSHVVLDSIMHSDMRPLAPLSGDNVLLHVVSAGGLHLLCVLSGVLGALLTGVLLLRRRGARVDGQA